MKKNFVMVGDIKCGVEKIHIQQLGPSIYITQEAVEGTDGGVIRMDLKTKKSAKTLANYIYKVLKRSGFKTTPVTKYPWR